MNNLLEKCAEILVESGYAAIYWQPYIEEYGKTIAEAEIACILSIVEQEEG